MPIFERDIAVDMGTSSTLVFEQGKGVVSLRGKMIDKPIVERARQTLEIAKQLGLDGGAE